MKPNGVALISLIQYIVHVPSCLTRSDAKSPLIARLCVKTAVDVK